MASFLEDAQATASNALDSAKKAVQDYGQRMTPPLGDLNRKIGDATAYNNTTYNVNSHVYPEDLMSSAGQYGDNYVIFYINVQESSKLVKNGKEGDFVPANQYTRITSDMVASEQNMTQLVTGQGVLVGGKVALGGSLAGGGGMLATAVEAVGV